VFDKLFLILKSSSKITVEPEHRNNQLSPLKYGSLLGLLAYFVMVVLNTKDIILMKRATVLKFRYLVDNYPEAIPSIFWPYQCARWKTSIRVDFLYSHFQTLPELKDLFIDVTSQQRTLAVVDDLYPELQIVVDKNGFFMREGMVTLNILVGKQRIFTIAFSFCKNQKGQVCAIVGAIQGKRMDCIKDLYRDMTKKAHGLRPRDLMVEVFQMVCKIIGVRAIYAVTELRRQHRHYFYWFKNKEQLLSLNYDEVWADRKGVRCCDDFYELPVRSERKPLNEIAAKKRAMYRKRYAMLERLEQEIEQGIKALGFERN
jgi:uncharacterized protein VirK/YbjX